ncbi:tail sheath protein [Rhizobium phage RHph_TM39]|uniref:Tail sheath protein n=2 Tax=Cuauhnahuacvirus TaxID=3044696 RepID=A0A7S5UZ14_9CAUD|nr:tail sheath [Rhizobium phage RHph_TM30]YP_010671499.1 tail sheath [Rhizobium phage RHph_Y65]QIG71821.1 tail sheath protein [Rhizobium phage RHph_TM40]QIG72182.1 tail sheath protein [Rhizobium phage RHph_TM2_3B]QIG77314.1 tail sheath protein [Rhizobium phage RHph_TM39]QIG77932.1 tail sheath protein [Rhizobium phage RHph_TM61]QIG71458.1 tail sheath protein [Rhizobium phage RHph_TM30]
MAAPYAQIKEIDISTRVPSFPGLYIGVVVPGAKKGPVNKAVLSTSDTQFLKTFTPNETVGVGFDNAHYSVLAALQKSNKVWTVRPSTTGMLTGGLKVEPASNATANSSFSAGEVDVDAHSFSTESFTIVGSNPGAWNNDLRIKIFNYKALETATVVQGTGIWTVTQDWGTGYPVRLSSTATLPAPLDSATTYFAIRVSATTIKLAASADLAVAGTAIVLTTAGSGTFSIRPATEFTRQTGTFAIQVFKKDNMNTYVESFICSKTPGTKDGYNNNIYLEDVLASSNYIRAVDNPSVTGAIKDQAVALAIVGGADGSAATDSDCILALQTLANPDSNPMTLLIDGGRATVNYHKAMIDICTARMDCVAILSTPYSAEDDSDYLNQIVAYKNYTLNANSSYAAIYTTHVKIYDRYNDRDLYVSPDGFVAGLVSETADNYELWFPVAGFRRGVLNVIDVRRRFTKGEMDYLYDNGINPLRFAPGRGIVVWGQKTLLATPSTLDRLNTRLLLISIEPSLKEALEEFLFEVNDDTTRSLVRSMVSAALESYVSRRGIYEYRVQCDTDNNSDDDISNHKLIVDVFIKPVESVEEIPCSLIVTRKGTEFKLAQAAV